MPNRAFIDRSYAQFARLGSTLASQRRVELLDDGYPERAAAGLPSAVHE